MAKRPDSKETRSRNRKAYELGTEEKKENAPVDVAFKRLKEAAEEHRMLLKALKEKDAKKTTRLLRQHIRNGREHVVGSLLQDKRLEI